jgi:hypothetical protein
MKNKGMTSSELLVEMSVLGGDSTVKRNPIASHPA